VTDSELQSQTLISDPGTSVPGSEVLPLETGRRKGRLRRAALPTLAMAPFFIYTGVGLGVPIVYIIRNAFLTFQGKFTFSNLDLLVHGIYLKGFENSLLLSAITAIIPGILGVFLAYAIVTSNSAVLKRMVATASAVLANFGGINLTFIFIAALGEGTGVITVLLNHIGLNPWNHGFDLYNFYGVALVYFYFQLPLMVLVITPALGGLRQSWREAAQNMGASNWRYWRHVGIPVLMPSILGGVLLLFGSSFAAYATAQTLTLGTVTLSPIQIGDTVSGNAIAGEANIGFAIALGMLIVLSITMLFYGLARRKASKWLR
jgi:putative spermidine/putrescine transport system permease protein